MKYFVSAGEASGDLHASRLIKALSDDDPRAEFLFLGGDKMAAAAKTAPLIHYRDMAFMGFSEVIRNFRKVTRNLRTAREALRRELPDALILVDYPSFNLRLAFEADKLGIPVFYFIPPKVWAWKKRRGHKIARLSQKVLSILPFEDSFWQRNFGTEAVYVGNPSVNEVDSRLAALPSREEFCISRGLDPQRPLIALLPGSRRGEIRNNLPVMDSVARHFPDFQPVIAGAPAIDRELYSAYSSYPVVDDATFDLLALSRAALVTSGTATLEAALAGVPQVVCYRANGSKIAYKIFKKILKVSHVSLPNLIAEEEIVPEQLLHLCTPEKVEHRLRPLLHDSDTRQKMLRGYAEVRRRLGTSDAALTAAGHINSRLAKNL